MFEKFIVIAKIIGYCYLAYFLVSLTAFIISLWGIFKKEKIPKYYSLIPFLNVHEYYKLCKLPFFTIFIPVINIIVFFCSFYVISNIYRCKRWQCFLAIILPFVFLPYIAFSNKKSIYFKYDNVFLKNNIEVSELEDKLVANSVSDELENDKSFFVAIPDPNIDANKEQSGEDSEVNIVDEYIYDEYKYENNLDVKGQLTDDILELNDDINIDDLSISNIEKYEKNLNSSSSVEKNIITDKKDYVGIQATDKSIAFGGEQRKEEIYEIETKHDELKCSRCGSSLVGATNICPGCGAPI